MDANLETRFPVTPTLTTTDWNEEWKALQVARAHPDNAAEWNERSKTFPTKHGGQFGYVDQFLAHVDILPGETVLDMGCGTGALATPLAKDGHSVIAADFAQGMLDVMCADQAEQGIVGVTPMLLSWSDDWEAHGLSDNCVDVAIASRSIMTADLKDSLLKLTRVARRRVFITLAYGSSPRTDPRLIKACGFSERVGIDFLYAFNILTHMGYAPEVSYIDGMRVDFYETLEDMVIACAKIVMHEVGACASAEDLAGIEARLRAWLPDVAVCDDRGYHLPEAPTTKWALIAWDTD